MNPILLVLSFVISRLREPSTHAGIAALLLALSQMFPAYALILQTAAAVFGGGAIAAPDPSAKRDQDNAPPRW